ncbi:MAG: FAD-binding oxidoreductase, partial [Pseudomonadota bacterium]
EVLDAAGMAERLETRRYHGGLAWRDGGHLHPLRYALGLAEAAATAGARIREHSPVTALRPGRVVTREGTVRAEHVILAMNGYVDGLEPEVARTVAPINSLVCATEPLGRERAEALMRTTACVFDTRFVLDYYRMTSDTRLVWGGAESYGTRFPRDIEVRMKKRILAVFPQLADVAITHAWGGTLGITRPRAPAFQRLGKSMLSVAGWSGSGIHMATMGGLIAADAVAGQAERFDLLARMPVPPFPGGDWLRQPLLALALSYYALRDRL